MSVDDSDAIRQSCCDCHLSCQIDETVPFSDSQRSNRDSHLPESSWAGFRNEHRLVDDELFVRIIGGGGKSIDPKG